MVRNKLIIPILIFILVCSVVVADEIIQNGFRITSSQDMYNCEPIFKGDACLIRAEIEVENTNNQAYNVEFDTEYETFIPYISYVGRGKSKFTRANREMFLGNSVMTIPLEFYVKEDGKFNFSLDAYQIGNGNHLFHVKLDPHYNVTINSTTPSYHLINGDVDVDSNNDFVSKINVSEGLSDLSDTTNYEIGSEIYGENNTYVSFVYLNTLVDYTGYVRYNDGNFTINLNTDGINKAMNLSFSTPIFDGVQVTINVSSDNLNNNFTFTDITGDIIYGHFDTTVANEFETYIVTLNNLGVNGNTSVYLWNIAGGDPNVDFEYISVFSPSLKGNALSAFFNHSFHNSTGQHWMRIRKITSGLRNITIHPYINFSDINTTNYVTSVILSGWNIVDVTSLITEGYNLPMRIYTENNSNISEIQLIEDIEDTILPVIINCSVNNTEIGYAEVVRLSCNVTDKYLTSVFFNWSDNISNYEQVDNILGTDIYYKDLVYYHNTPIGGEVYTFNEVVANDVTNSSIELINLDFNYTNYVCVPDWNASYINPSSCFANNTYFATKVYTDLNGCNNYTTLPGDNGSVESVSCGYGSVIDCLTNIAPPFTDKMPWLCKINDTKPYKCNSYVMIDGRTIQINPEREIIDLFGFSDSFNSNNGLVNAYFTQENIRISDNHTYDFVVKCSYNDTTLNYTHQVVPYYVAPVVFTDRLLWAKDNAGYIMGGVIVIMFILLIIIGLYHFSGAGNK